MLLLWSMLERKMEHSDSIDYRLLKQKTVPDRHPLPPIQDLINTLGSHSWFTILDKRKAYYQGYIAEGCRHMTAFVTPWGYMSG